MASTLILQRAENEIKLATIIFTISERPALQTTAFDIEQPETYYSAVIAHCYYSIFYAAKAYLHTKGVRVTAPEEHKRAFEAFRKFVESGELDVELLQIYREALVRAESLLGIFQIERKKRGEYTYRTFPQANKEPANESIEHAKTFYRNLKAVCEKPSSVS